MQAFKSKSYVRGATNLALGCLVALAKKETRYTALNGKKKKKKEGERSGLGEGLHRERIIQVHIPS